jgi:putative ABC transport system ATP-binding protein
LTDGPRPAEAEPIIELHDLFKIYDEDGQQTVALRGAGLAVTPGEWVAILGASGSGKSTLLSLAAGLNSPSAGEVRLAGQSLGAMPEDGRARARRAGLALAVALANDPPLLLADELTGELDSDTADEVMGLLADLNRERGLAVVLVTHNPAVAARADRILHMANGVLQPSSSAIDVDTDERAPRASTGNAAELGSVVLDAVDLVKTYPGGVKALRGISLAIRSGESLAIVGPSGCGKSTLLNLLGSLDRPTAGSLSLGGRSLSTLEAANLALVRRREIGFIFQAHNLVATLTAVENVALPLILDGVAETDWRPRAEALLDRVGLAPATARLPDQLSGGERQRVAIARALAHRPRVLLADEPTGSLDSDNADQITRLLVDLADVERVALIVVTHDPRVAAACARVLQLRDGLEVRGGAR